MVSLNPAVTGQGRTFINTDGAGCGNSFSYLGCYKVDSLEQSLGDITSIYCPSDEQYDAFVEVASIRGADSRWTSTLTGTLPVDTETELEKIRRRGCSFNLQVHFGACNRPDDFSSFNSAIVLQDVRLTNYNLSSLTALSPDERAAVSETASISAGSSYRVFPLEYSTTATNVATTGAIVGVTICDSIRCGTLCNSVGPSDGCERVYALNIIEGSVPSLIFTVDGGLSWQQRDTDIAVSNALPNTNFGDFSVKCIDGDLWLSIYDGTDSSIYIIDPEGVELTASNFSSVTVGTLSNVIVRDMDLGSNNVYVVGEANGGGSYIAIIDKTSQVITVIDDSVLSLTINFLSVDAIDDNVVLIGATDGRVAFSSVEGSFALNQIAVNGVNVTDDVNDVHLIDDTNWLVEAGGSIYCTGNRGTTWTQLLATGNPGKFSFYDNVLGFFQNSNNIYRTMDGGNSWDSVATISGVAPGNIIACTNNPNVYYSGGGNLDADTPFIIRGVAT